MCTRVHITSQHNKKHTAKQWRSKFYGCLGFFTPPFPPHVKSGLFAWYNHSSSASVTWPNLAFTFLFWYKKWSIRKHGPRRMLCFVVDDWWRKKKQWTPTRAFLEIRDVPQFPIIFPIQRIIIKHTCTWKTIDNTFIHFFISLSLPCTRFSLVSLWAPLSPKSARRLSLPLLQALLHTTMHKNARMMSFTLTRQSKNPRLQTWLPGIHHATTLISCHS